MTYSRLSAYTCMISAVLLSAALSSDQPISQLSCVAELEKGQVAFAEIFAKKSGKQRRACLAQILASLSPEPEFTATNVERSLDLDGGGRTLRDYPDWRIESGFRDRFIVNARASFTLEELAKRHLID